jgi:hypothetical protein
MSAIVDGDSGGSASAFNPMVIAAMIAAGIVAFIAYWVLSAFAPDLSSGRDGGQHALSRSATSYSAIIEILRASGTTVEIDRREDNQDAGLLILTPPMTATAEDIAERIDAHGDRPVLVVLPRWSTVPHESQRGWVSRAGPANPFPMLIRPPFTQEAAFSDSRGGAIGYGIVLPPTVRTISAPGLVPVISAPDGRAVVASLSRRPRLMILADADLIANHGVGTAERARSSVALIDAIAPGLPITFDVQLNGYGGGRSLVRLAFTPPFLGLTLCLLAAGLLALWSGFARFGPPWRDVRTIAFGKAGLVANSARLIVQAGRVRGFSQTYADQVRDSVARRLHAPAGLSGTALVQWLDRFPGSRDARYSRLVADLAAARTTSETVARARALGQWRKDILRDSH